MSENPRPIVVIDTQLVKTKSGKSIKIAVTLNSLVLILFFSLLPIDRLIAQTQPSISSLIFSPDGSKILLNTSNAIEIYDANFQLLVSLPHDDLNNPRRAFSWSPDGTKLKVDFNQIYDAETLQLVQTIDSGRWGMGGWNSDGTLMWARDPEKVGLVLIDTALDQIVQHISTGELFIEAAAWSPDSEYFITFAGSKLIVMNVQHGGIVARYDLGYYVQTAAWSPNSQQIATSLLVNPENMPISYAIHLVDTNTGNVSEKIDGLEGSPSGLFFSLDGDQLTALVGTNIVRTWDLETGQLIDEHIFGTGIGAMDQSPYGGRLIMETDSTKELTVSVPPDAKPSERLTTYLEDSIQMIVPAPSIEKLTDIVALCDLTVTANSVLETLIHNEQFQEFVNEVSGFGDAQMNPGCKADALAVAHAILPH